MIFTCWLRIISPWLPCCERNLSLANCPPACWAKHELWPWILLSTFVLRFAFHSWLINLDLLTDFINMFLFSYTDENCTSSSSTCPEGCTGSAIFYSGQVSHVSPYCLMALPCAMGHWLFACSGFPERAPNLPVAAGFDMCTVDAAGETLPPPSGTSGKNQGT